MILWDQARGSFPSLIPEKPASIHGKGFGRQSVHAILVFPLFLPLLHGIGRGQSVAFGIAPPT
jgi:hypothetical protein